MKTAPLLLAFPLLLPVCTLYAAPRELREDGRYEFRDTGSATPYVISRNEVHRQNPEKGSKRIFLSPRDSLRSTLETARQLSAETGDRVELVAYPEGQTPSEENRRIVCRSVSLRLDPGVSALAVASAAGATSYRGMVYAPHEYVLQFADVQAALSAAEDLKAVPGVSKVTVELGRKWFPKALPTFNDKYLTYAGTDIHGQAVDVWYDFYNQKTKEPAGPFPLSVLFRDGQIITLTKNNVWNYQWYLHNEGAQMDPSMFYPAVRGGSIPPPPPDVYNPDSVPPFAVPNDNGTYNPFFDLYADVNAFAAWSQTNELGQTYDGTGVRVAVMDDGIETKHVDLSQATLFDLNSSYNFQNPDLTYRPTDITHLDPKPAPTDGGYFNHGTGVAGLIFSRPNNGAGMLGVAYGARMIGYRFTGGDVSLPYSVESDMYAWGSTRLPAQGGGEATGNEWRQGPVKFDVSVNAYGPALSGQSLYDVHPFYKKSIAYGTTAGREGKGVIYVFSGGNEGKSHGNTNYAWTSNSIYTFPVGSVSDMGRRTLYSSPGASLVVVAPSSGEEMMPAILRGSTVFPPNPVTVPALDADRALGWTVSVDDYWPYTNAGNQSRLRNSQYVLTTNVAQKANATGPVTVYNPNFGGTSASTAMVGGVVALMLQANPSLGWRDVKEILMRSARVVDALNGEWSFNNMGMPMSHKYGAGLVDAGHAVAMAKVWKNLGARNGTLSDNEYSGETKTLAGGIITGRGTGYVRTIPPPNSSLRVEHVVVKLKIEHSRRGDLGIILTGPGGGQVGDSPIESYLFVPHREDQYANIGMPAEPNDNTEKDGEYYEFSSVRHWGTSADNPLLKAETGSGATDWKLKIYDNTDYGKTVTGDVNSTKLVDGVFVDRVSVGVDNNSSAGNVKFASVTFHGTNVVSENQSPVILPTKIVARPGRQLFFPIKAITDNAALGDQNIPRAPMLAYHFKVLGPKAPTTTPLFTSPNGLTGLFTNYPEPKDGDPPLEKYPSFRFGLKDGILTNVMTPSVVPDVQWRFSEGVKGESVIVADPTGLTDGMYVIGKGIRAKARIATGGIDPVTHKITLTGANIATVDGFVRFTGQGASTGAKGEFTIKMQNVTGLKEGMYVYGGGLEETGIAAGARIAINGINTATKEVRLTVANVADVNEVLFFTDTEDFAYPSSVKTAKGSKNSLILTVSDTSGLYPGLHVAGKGIALGAKINTIKDATTVNLTVVNSDVVDGEVRFNDVREFNPLVEGTWSVEVTGTNIFGTTRKQMDLEVRSKVTYDEWAQTFYPTITDPNGDPDGDGINNLMEFITGGDPYKTDSYGLPSTSFVDGKLVFRYQIDTNAVGARLVPKVSSDLSTWNTVTPVAEPPASGSTLRYYTVTLDPTVPRQFFRLEGTG